MADVSDLHRAFENDLLSNIEIFDLYGERLGLSFDDVQRQRKAYRREHGLPPLKRGRKPVKLQPATPTELANALKQAVEAQPTQINITLSLDPAQLRAILDALRKD